MKIKLVLGLLIAMTVSACGPAIGKGAEEPSDNTGEQGEAQERDQGDPSEPSEGMVELKVANLLARPNGGVLVLLMEQGGLGRIVPMVVGDTEGDAMARRLSRQRYVRPLTHDLMEIIFKKIELRVVKVEIDDLKDAVFLARLYLVDKHGVVTRVDSRPSDGITLALGSEAPVFISTSVIDEIGEPAKQWEELLEDMPAEPQQQESTGWPKKL